jgi:hypothetical protein
MLKGWPRADNERHHNTGQNQQNQRLVGTMNPQTCSLTHILVVGCMRLDLARHVQNGRGVRGTVRRRAEPSACDLAPALPCLRRAHQQAARPRIGRQLLRNDRFFRDMRAVVNGLLKHVELRSETHGGEVVRILQEILKAERAAFYAEQVRNFKQKIATTSEESMRLLENMMVDRRRQMADRLAAIARTELQPALDRARYESGRGMKQRMLQTIEYHARSVVDRTYATIQAGLIEGLKELEINIVKHLEDIRKEADKQADIFANNCSVDTDRKSV